jgi:putative inorganic carbon (HCO3(-)) transporter
MASAAQPRVSFGTSNPIWPGAALALRPLHALMACPSWLFLAALTAMLFRPPDLKLYGIDRIAFVVLMFVVLLRALMLRQPLRVPATVMLPLTLLLVIAVAQNLLQPYQPEAWSVLAAKWIVPCGLFFAARLVFESENELRRLEIFLLLVLGYLAITAILFLSGSKSLIFPPFIVDEGLGVHADRARGPFLQAVANGVTLNLLGLVALDAYRRRRIQDMLALAFVIALPLAVLATKTRAVWASFGMAVVALLLFSSSQRIRRACQLIVVAASLALLCALTFGDVSRPMQERLEERSPVQFRMAVYRAGWDMFLAKPLTGWGTAQMQPELARRISDFHQNEFYFHNTFLEVAVEYGLVGLGLYLWIMFDLLHVGSRHRARAVARDGHFLDLQFRSLWPVFLAVYLLNACFVVMNYQFVNGLLFAFAGILAAQNESEVYADGN